MGHYWAGIPGDCRPEAESKTPNFVKKSGSEWKQSLASGISLYHWYLLVRCSDPVKNNVTKSNKSLRTEPTTVESFHDLMGNPNGQSIEMISRRLSYPVVWHRSWNLVLGGSFPVRLTWIDCIEHHFTATLSVFRSFPLAGHWLWPCTLYNLYSKSKTDHFCVTFQNFWKAQTAKGPPTMAQNPVGNYCRIDSQIAFAWNFTWNPDNFPKFIIVQRETNGIVVLATSTYTGVSLFSGSSFHPRALAWVSGREFKVVRAIRIGRQAGIALDPQGRRGWSFGWCQTGIING